jgi:hypothetical protein
MWAETGGAWRKEWEETSDGWTARKLAELPWHIYGVVMLDVTFRVPLKFLLVM